MKRKQSRASEISRRQFCGSVAAVLVARTSSSLWGEDRARATVDASGALAPQTAGKLDVVAIDRARILKAAQQYLKERPVTIAAASSPRSAGGPHDYFSEGDYWWPDPKDPKGP